MSLLSPFTVANFSLWIDTFTSRQLNSTLLLPSQSLFSEKIHLNGLAIFVWQFNYTLLLCLCYLSSLMKNYLYGLTLLLRQLNSTLLLPLQCLFLEKISSQCHMGLQFSFCYLIQYCRCALLFLFTDEFLFFYGLMLLLRQLNSALLLRLDNLSVLKKCHLNGLAIFLWQFYLILLLCLCYLSFLVQNFLYKLMHAALATQFGILTKRMIPRKNIICNGLHFSFVQFDSTL